ALRAIPFVRISGLRSRTETWLEGRSIKKCQPILPPAAPGPRSQGERGLSLSCSYNCRRPSTSGSNAAANDVSLANWLIEKTTSLQTSACRLRRHATRLPSRSGPSRRYAPPQDALLQIMNTTVRVASVRAPTGARDDIGPMRHIYSELEHAISCCA